MAEERDAAPAGVSKVAATGADGHRQERREWFSSSVLLADHRHRLLRYHPVRGVHLHLHSNAHHHHNNNRERRREEDDDCEGGPRDQHHEQMPLPAADKSIPTEWHDVDRSFLLSAWGSHALQSWEVSTRVMRRCLASLQDPKTEVGLVVMVGSVMGLGMYEGYLLTKKRSLDMETLRFITRYGWENVLPSFIWKTKQAATIVRAQGREFPSKLLWTPSHPITSEEASRQSLIQSLQTMRAMVAGFVGIAQAFNVVAQGIEASHQYRQKVMHGREPMLTYSGPKERVVRLGGKSSDCTELSVELDGLHIVPIVEDPGILHDFTQKGKYPIFWSIRARSYGKRHSWNGFNVDHKWLIRTEQGKRILVVEADSSVGEQSLSLRHDLDEDLTIQDASQAFFMIEQRLRKDPAVTPEDKVIRVLLADPQMSIETGGGNRYTVADRVRELREVDVLIDSKAPLLRAILDWANGKFTAGAATHDGNEQPVGRTQPDEPDERPGPSRKKIVFDTTNRGYFRTLRGLLSNFGFEVLDARDTERYDPRTTPRLVYMETTFDTLNTIRSLVNVGLVPANQCCALVDRKEGLEVAEDINEALLKRAKHNESEAPQQMSVICSSVIYDNLFRQVRLLLRKGHTPVQVQEELDKAFRSYSLAMPGSTSGKEAPAIV